MLQYVNTQLLHGYQVWKARAATIQVQKVLCFAMQVCNWWNTRNNSLESAKRCQNLFCCHRHTQLACQCGIAPSSLQLSLLIQLNIVIVGYQYNTIWSLASGH